MSMEAICSESSGPLDWPRRKHGDWRPRSIAVAQLDSASACNPGSSRFMSVNPSVERLYKLPSKTPRGITISYHPIGTCTLRAASRQISLSP